MSVFKRDIEKIQAFFSRAGYPSDAAIAAGLKITDCPCGGRTGGDIIRSAMHHAHGPAKLLRLLARAVRDETDSKRQSRRTIKENQLLMYLYEYPGTSGNALVEGLRWARSQVYMIIHELADSKYVRYDNDGRAKLWRLAERGEADVAKLLKEGTPVPLGRPSRSPEAYEAMVVRAAHARATRAARLEEKRARRPRLTAASSIPDDVQPPFSDAELEKVGRTVEVGKDVELFSEDQKGEEL